MTQTGIAAVPVRPRHFEELVIAVPLPFTPWSVGLTDYQHAIIGTADQYAKDIVAGILDRAARQSNTLEKFYASLAGAGVWPSDPSPAMSVIDDMVEEEEGHPLDDRTLYHLTVALVHHDMLTAINADRDAIKEAKRIAAVHHIDSFELEAAGEVRETMQRLIDKGLTLRTTIGHDYVEFTLKGTKPAVVENEADISHQIMIRMSKQSIFTYTWMVHPAGKILPIMHGDAPTLAQAAADCFAAGIEMQDGNTELAVAL